MLPAQPKAGIERHDLPPLEHPRKLEGCRRDADRKTHEEPYRPITFFSSGPHVQVYEKIMAALSAPQEKAH